MHLVITRDVVTSKINTNSCGKPTSWTALCNRNDPHLPKNKTNISTNPQNKTNTSTLNIMDTTGAHVHLMPVLSCNACNEYPVKCENMWGHLSNVHGYWHTTSVFDTFSPRRNCRLFADDISKSIFLHENILISSIVSLNFAPIGQINNIPALVQITACGRLGDKPLSEPMMVSLLTHSSFRTPPLGTPQTAPT